ncbi:MAG: hypothetical protein ACFFE5_09375 [Candidatus Thorarchaeota archaeon]
MSVYLLDLILFLIINIANLNISAIYVSRVKKPGLERILGIFYITLGIPTLLIIIINILLLREWWFWIFPLLFLIFIVFELIIDYVKEIEFRNPRKLKVLVPYLIMYYVSIILMWGLNWTLGIFYGTITGITYFLQLACAIYASKHGVG